jgi:uncharacterized protein DUF6916
MALSRRTFLYTSMLTGLGTTLPWSLSHAATWNADLADMTSDTFLPYVNTRFGLLLGKKRVTTATLVEVNVFDPPADGTLETASQDAFSLVFRAPRQPPLRQNTYTVRHGMLGTFSLLLVPIGRRRVHYEAVFNRLRV